MAEQKLYAGHAVRRLRRRVSLTQSDMAERLGISASYLNLIERNARPLTAALLLKLAATFELDPRTLGTAPADGAEGLRRRLADPLFADLEIDRHEISEWLAAAPGGAEAFARLFDARGSTEPATRASDPPAEARAAIERWRNNFADLDAHAENLADELRMGSGDLYGAVVERLRVKHEIGARIMPVDVMPDRLRRLDLHARQLQLSELLDGASRTFAAAFHLAQIEAKPEIDALAKGAAVDGQTLPRPAERLFRRHLTSYWAAALVMPYGRFLRACEATGYDVELLQRRFGAGFEQVAHRLTTLGRVGARGLPFFMLRIDRAGQVSKRYAGASGSPLVEARGRCPLWNLHAAFEAPGTLVRDLVELQDTGSMSAGGSRWFTLARTVSPQGGRIGQVRARFVVGLGLEARLAEPLAAARGLDLDKGAATPIGLGCRQCTRPDCPQRSAPPVSRALVFNDRERGVSPFEFAGD